jgi:hypothetical protein
MGYLSLLTAAGARTQLHIGIRKYRYFDVFIGVLGVSGRRTVPRSECDHYASKK